MVGQIISLTLTFLLVWSGRDKVWSPTFKGTREERFAKAVEHYNERMGLEPAVVEILPGRLIIDGAPRCFWARRIPGFMDDAVGMSQARSCHRLKPEFGALHEQSHRRMKHLDMSLMDHEEKEREVEECMRWYSAKERR